MYSNSEKICSGTIPEIRMYEMRAKVAPNLEMKSKKGLKMSVYKFRRHVAGEKRKLNLKR